MIGSIIIPYKNGNQFRERNLLFTLGYYLSNFSDIEIILSEQNCNSVLLGDLKSAYGDRFIHCIHDIEGEFFNKSKVINLAVSKSTTDFVMMIDGDVILPIEAVYHAFEYCKTQKCSMYQPFSYINYLTESQTRQYIKTGDLSQYKMSDIMPIQKYTGGVNVFSKDNFELVNGYDEYICGWGSEDDAFLYKMKQLKNPVHWCSDKITLLHLWHPKSNTTEYLNSPRYIANRKASACIQRMSVYELSEYLFSYDASYYLKEKIAEYESKGLLHLMCKIPVSNTFISIDSTVYPVSFDSSGVGTFKNFCDVFIAESSYDELIRALQRMPNIFNSLTKEESDILNSYT